MKREISRDFVDETGTKAEMHITSNSNTKINLGANYKLQRPESNNKYMAKNAKAKGIFTSDIGIKSEGFAPIFTLALIVALGTLAIISIIWRIR